MLPGAVQPCAFGCLAAELGYDDDALGAALGRAGAGAKQLKIADYAKPDENFAIPNIAVVEAAGDIVDGSAGTSGFRSPPGSGMLVDSAADYRADGLGVVVHHQDLLAWPA